jgi:hypothetical protein
MNFIIMPASFRLKAYSITFLAAKGGAYGIVSTVHMGAEELSANQNH